MLIFMPGLVSPDTRAHTYATHIRAHMPPADLIKTDMLLLQRPSAHLDRLQHLRMVALGGTTHDLVHKMQHSRVRVTFGCVDVFLHPTGISEIHLPPQKITGLSLVLPRQVPAVKMHSRVEQTRQVEIRCAGKQ